MPAISVLMPVYNASKYVKEAIDSVLNQTFEDFEFLIINDGSTDDTAAIVQSYYDARIKFIQNEANMGIAATLNKGIDLASADLIARMDADDICYPERLERQYNFIQQNPDGALYSCWVKKVTEQRNLIKDHKLNTDHYFFNQTFSCWVYHPTMVYRKEAVTAIGKYSVPYAEDFELVWQISRRYKMYHQPEILLEYRSSEQSLCQVTKKDEYLNANIKLVSRNIRSYLPNGAVNLRDVHAEILNCYHPEPEIHQDSLKLLMESIEIMRLVKDKMLGTINPNIQRTEHIEDAYIERKNFLITTYFYAMGYVDKFRLCVRTGRWSLVSEGIRTVLKIG